jgi:hypothetical protein
MPTMSSPQITPTIANAVAATSRVLAGLMINLLICRDHRSRKERPRSSRRRRTPASLSIRRAGMENTGL